MVLQAVAKTHLAFVYNGETENPTWLSGEKKTEGVVFKRRPQSQVGFDVDLIWTLKIFDSPQTTVQLSSQKSIFSQNLY